MRLAIISDIHGNLEALSQVLTRIDDSKVDEIVCLGDIVGYGPFPEECIALVRQHCKSIVRGNHDAGAAGEQDLDHFGASGRAALEWTIPRLSVESIAFLRTLPFTLVDPALTAVHASPVHPEQWAYVRGWSQAKQVFNGFSTPFCAFGHIHIPMIVAEDGSINSLRPGVKVLINPGSIGQPRDGNPHASFAVLDTDALTANIIRVPYDVASTAAAILKAGLPEVLANRLYQGF
jgi:putative phosphoesterase